MAALPVEALWVLGAAVMAGMEKKAQADRDKQAEEQKRTHELSSLRSQVEAMTKQQQEQQHTASTTPITIETVRVRDKPETLAQVEAYKRTIDEYKQSMVEERQRFDEITQQMGESKITNFDDLRKKDATAFDAMVELAKEAKPVPMEGNHIAIFGVVARGKSTFVNSTIGRKVAETGKGETTTKLAACPGRGFTIWDVPGRNDNLSYFTLEYIGFWKVLRHRVILVTDTVKEMTTVCWLMDELSLEYTIVVNRLQFADEEEESPEQRQKFEQQIKDEVVSLELKSARDRVYFISARTPAKYPEDWNGLQKMLMSE